MQEYLVGDTVIHKNHGLGMIIGMDEKLIHERQTLCYVVRTSDLTIWVTAEENGQPTLRLPTADKDFEALFIILHGAGESLPVNFFDRKLQLIERMKDGQLDSICSVIRDLAALRRGKKLNYSDLATFERAQNLLLAEWVYSRDVSRSQASIELLNLLRVD